MNEQEKQHFLLDILVQRFRAVCRSQTIYVHTLLLYLAFLWVWESFKSENALSLSFAGLSMKAKNIWPITPAVVTLLCLGLIGSLNAMGPVWRRLKEVHHKLSIPETFFTDFDTSSNILDYLSLLTPRPEKKLQVQDPPWGHGTMKWRLQRFLYPLLILAGTITTLLSWPKGPSNWIYQTYVVLCATLQALFSVRIWWRAICGAFSKRLEQNELI